MTFKLNEDYDNPIEARMATVGWVIANGPDQPCDTDAEGLFVALVRGVMIYVEAWHASDPTGSLASFVLDAEDMDDPSRADDPHATFLTMLELTLEQIMENIHCEIDPSHGAAQPDE